MLTSADLAVLNEAYRNSKKGVEAINAVISKVYDEDLALDLNRQAVRFLSFEDNGPPSGIVNALSFCISRYFPSSHAVTVVCTLATQQ